jgi:hypothetical protein
MRPAQVARDQKNAQQTGRFFAFDVLSVAGGPVTFED